MTGRLTCIAAVVCVSACNFVHMRRDGIRADLRDWGLTNNSVELGDATVAYWEGGEGRPLLLLHGFGASAMWQWHHQAEPFLSAHRLIVPNLLWFGGSWSSERDFTIDHQVRTVVALLDELDIPQADVVGISYGGLVAHEIAGQHPERIRRVIIVDSPGRAFTRADEDALYKRFGTRDLAELLVPREADGVTRLLEIAYYDPPWTPGFVRQSVLDEMYATHRDEKALLLKTALESLEELSTRSYRVEQPALVMWGRQDPFFPLEVGRKLAGLLNARIHIIDEARHAPNMEHPEEFNRVVLTFLAAADPK